MNDRTWVLTPEKVVLSYRLAGVGSRMSAFLIDLCLLFVVIMALSIFTTSLQMVSPELAIAISAIASSAVAFLYFALQEGLWQGQTLGKRTANIRVTMADGTPITFSAALYRNILRLLDIQPFLLGAVGLLGMALTERSQRLGDIVAGTVVVHEPPAGSTVVAPHRYGIHRFEAEVGDLQGMTMEEYVALKRLTDRFPELPPAAQERSIQEIWTPFAARYGIASVPNVHPVYLMEAVVMKFGRLHKLL